MDRMLLPKATQKCWCDSVCIFDSLEGNKTNVVSRGDPGGMHVRNSIV